MRGKNERMTGHILSGQDTFKQILFSKGHFHEVVFGYLHKGLHSHIAFVFRTVLLWAAIVLCQYFLHHLSITYPCSFGVSLSLENSPYDIDLI